jgi:hypothetical protein
MARNFDDPFIFLHGPSASDANRIETANSRVGAEMSSGAAPQLTECA